MIPFSFPWLDSQAWAVMPEWLGGFLEAITADPDRLLEATVTNARTQARARPLTPPGVAVIPIVGLLTQRPTWFSTSTQEIAANVRDAITNPRVSAVVLDVDSPGGSVFGIEEAAAEIASYRGRKPIIAVANSRAASAAYWLGSSADEIVVTPGGEVGAIGVYTVHTETSKADEREGFKHTVISAGRYKAEGLPYFPLGKDAQQAYQERVNELYGLMTTRIASNRKTTPEAVRDGYAEGRMAGAMRAVDLGMADRVETFEATLARLSGETSLPADMAAESDQPATIGADFEQELNRRRQQLDLLTLED